MSKSIDPATDPNIKERATKELLRVTLTEDEKVKLAERMAEKQAELEDLEVNMSSETNLKSERKHEDFAAAAKPLIEWLNNFGHQHMKVIVENDGAEVVEGCMSCRTEEFLRD